MFRKASPDDFDLVVEGVGNFSFARRTMRDEMKIQVEYARFIDGVTPTDWLRAVAGWLSVLNVLTVRAPEGWDTEAMDPLDDDTYSKMLKVYTALITQERSFRGIVSEGSKAQG